MEIIQVTKQPNLMLGHQGENLARRMEFDLSDWMECYGDGTAELIYQRPGDEKPYPVATIREGNKLVWTVSNTDTAVASSYSSPGHCELRFYVGDALVKSQTWRTWVSHAMDTPAETEPPAPDQGWVEQVLATGAASKASADTAKADADRAAVLAADVTAKAAQTAQDATVSAQAKEAAQSAQSHAEAAQKVAESARDRAERAAIRQPYPNAETGTWWLWDANTGSYKDSNIKSDGNDGKPGKDGEPGKDGYTPQKGVDYFDGADGKDGRDGADGQDGKSAYQSAAEAGYTGTEQEFSAALQCVPAHLDDTVAHITSEEREAWNAKRDVAFKPEGDAYLTFRSTNPFTLAVNNASKNWDGILQYFNAGRTWTEWDGTAAIASIDSIGEQVIYLRGIGNTVITGGADDYRKYFVISGSNVRCDGSIENLLDYATVSNGNHPTMGERCFSYLFYHNSSLISAPALPAAILSQSCYFCLFSWCVNLMDAPELPATTLAPFCYFAMFNQCHRLTCAPELPARSLADGCYFQMFVGCSSLLSAPDLPATALQSFCYAQMFEDCTNLTTVPKLPATEFFDACYNSMFRGCTALKLSATKTGEYTKAYCIKSTQAGRPAESALRDMFAATGGTFAGTPDVNTTYYLSSDNHILGEVDDHLVNTDNPHGVTAEQIGAVSKEYVDSKAEMILPPINAGDHGKYLRVDSHGAWTVLPGELTTVLDWYRCKEADENVNSALLIMSEIQATLPEKEAALETAQAELQARRDELEKRKDEFLREYDVTSPDMLDEDVRAEYDAIVAEGELIIEEAEEAKREAQAAVDEAQASVNEAQALYDESSAILSDTSYASEYCSEAMRSIVLPPVTAAVGQTIRVKAVDANGKPTEWEAADMGGGLYMHTLKIKHKNGWWVNIPVYKSINTPITTFVEITGGKAKVLPCFGDIPIDSNTGKYCTACTAQITANSSAILFSGIVSINEETLTGTGAGPYNTSEFTVTDTVTEE